MIFRDSCKEHFFRSAPTSPSKARGIFPPRAQLHAVSKHPLPTSPEQGEPTCRPQSVGWGERSDAQRGPGRDVGHRCAHPNLPVRWRPASIRPSAQRQRGEVTANLDLLLPREQGEEQRQATSREAYASCLHVIRAKDHEQALRHARAVAVLVRNSVGRRKHNPAEAYAGLHPATSSGVAPPPGECPRVNPVSCVEGRRRADRPPCGCGQGAGRLGAHRHGSHRITMGFARPAAIGLRKPLRRDLAGGGRHGDISRARLAAAGYDRRPTGAPGNGRRPANQHSGRC